jgi:hypothetical protein
VTPEATIVHHGGASEATRSGKTCRLLKAKATLIDRHWPRGTVEAGQFLLMAWPLTRWLACAAAARVGGDGARYGPAAAVWREVWDARCDWRFGYPKPDPSQAEREAAKPLLPAASWAAGGRP